MKQTAATAALAAAALAFLSAPAQAQMPNWPSADEVAKAFKAICVDNAGNPEAQARAAQSGPWNLVRKPDSTADNQVFFKMPWQVSIVRTKDLNVCVIVSGADASNSPDVALAAATKVFRLAPASVTREAKGFSWNFNAAGKSYLVVYDQDADDSIVTASYALGGDR